MNEYCEYILQLKKIFPQVNKEYMLEVVKKENEFVKDSCNENFDHNGLKHFYADILKKLNENRIIMQVGGRTVFYDKTFMFALGKDYEENFSKYFNSRKNKNEPIVQSMNLTKIDNSYYPLGFIEIEL